MVEKKKKVKLRNRKRKRETFLINGNNLFSTEQLRMLKLWNSISTQKIVLKGYVPTRLWSADNFTILV